MKKSLLFAAAAVLAVTASAQSRQQAFEAQSQNQYAAEAVQMTEDAQGVDLHMLSQAEIRADRKKAAANATLKAWYNRPKGCFWTSNITLSTSKGYSSFYAPYISGSAFSTWTFEDASTGATAYSWKVWYRGSAQTVTAKNFNMTYPVSTDTVPELTVADSTSTSTFKPYGKNGTTTYPCYLNSYPNYPAQYSTTLANRCWSTPKFFGANSTRAGGTAGAYYSTIKDASGAAAGMLMGYNTVGWNEMAVAYEASEAPYAVHQVGLRFQGMTIDSTADVSVPITATIYALDEVPAYNDTDYVTVVPEKVIATKTINVTYASMKESNCYQNASTYAFSGILAVAFDEAVNIPAGQAVLVAIKGYNTAAFSTSFTSVFSADYNNEGYGECGYIGAESNGKDMFLGFHNSYLASTRYTAPALLCDIERPFHVFNYTSETGERNFDPKGQKDTIQIFSSRSSEQWKVQCKDGSEVPAWLGAAVKDTVCNSYYALANATFDVQPLPEGTSYREATLTYTYPGAYLEVFASQGEEPTGVANVKMSGYQARVLGGDFVVNSTAAANVEIFNVAGQLVRSAKVQEGTTVIDGQSLSNGVYMVRMNNNTVKVIK